MTKREGSLGGFVMRRLIQRRKRLTALSLILAIVALIVTLAGGKWFEPTAQGRNQTPQSGITIKRTAALGFASAEVHQKLSDPGVVKRDQPPVDSTWRTTFHHSFSASANLNGGSAAASGDLDANLAVSGD